MTKRRYDPNWPRWRVVQGSSVFTIPAPDAETAERRAAAVGFRNPKAERIID